MLISKAFTKYTNKRLLHHSLVGKFDTTVHFTRYRTQIRLMRQIYTDF
jgi:hypothetical protein